MVEWEIYEYGWSEDIPCNLCDQTHHEPRWLVTRIGDRTGHDLEGWCADCMRKEGLLW